MCAPLLLTPLGGREGPRRPKAGRGPGLSLCCTWGGLSEPGGDPLQLSHHVLQATQSPKRGMKSSLCTFCLGHSSTRSNFLTNSTQLPTTFYSARSDGGVRRRSGRAQVPPVREPGTHSVCSSSGLGTHCSRCDSSWKALLCGSSMSSPYRALIRYGWLFTSSSCRRRSAGGWRRGSGRAEVGAREGRGGGQVGSDGTAAWPGGQTSGWAPRMPAPAPAVSELSP